MVKTPCKVEVDVRERAAYLKVSGAFDRTAPLPNSIVENAFRTSDRLAILDLSETSSIDSQGLERLERFFAYAEGQGVTLRIVAPKPSKVRRVLELVRFDRFLVLAGSVLEAVRFGRGRKAEKRRAPGKA